MSCSVLAHKALDGAGNLGEVHHAKVEFRGEARSG
jgi:hypothetical protein